MIEPNQQRMPMAEGAERAVLSVMFQYRDTHMPLAMADGLTEEHFHHPGHREFYKVLGELYRRGEKFDITTLGTDMRFKPLMEALGGPSSLVEIFTYAPHQGHWDQHVRVLRQHLASRITMKATVEAAEAAQESPEDAVRIMQEATVAAQRALQPPRAVITSLEAVEMFVARLEENYKRGSTPGLSTGFACLDLITGGPRRGELWVISGASTSGKSVLLTQIGSTLSFAGHKGLVASLEMGADEITGRIISRQWNIPHDILTNPRSAKREDLLRIQAAAEQYKGVPFNIMPEDEFESEVNIDRISSLARLVHSTTGIEWLMVDYLQLVAGGRRRGESREQEVAHVSRSLKRLARSLGIPVLTASQLNDDGKMRESRSIFHDADVLLGIEADGVMVVKNRNGRRGDILPLRQDFRYQRFYEAQQDWRPDEQ